MSKTPVPELAILDWHCFIFWPGPLETQTPLMQYQLWRLLAVVPCSTVDIHHAARLDAGAAGVVGIVVVV